MDLLLDIVIAVTALTIGVLAGAVLHAKGAARAGRFQCDGLIYSVKLSISPEVNAFRDALRPAADQTVGKLRDAIDSGKLDGVIERAIQRNSKRRGS